MQPPYLLYFEQLGNASEGYLTTTQYADRLPFEVKRVFWTYGIPSGVERGNHANKMTEEVLIAISGNITVKAEWSGGEEEFKLNSPNCGMYIPALCWTTLSFSSDAIAVCLASTDFSEKDYIRDYPTFVKMTDGKN